MGPIANSVGEPSLEDNLNPGMTHGNTFGGDQEAEVLDLFNKLLTRLEFHFLISAAGLRRRWAKRPLGHLVLRTLQCKIRKTTGRTPQVPLDSKGWRVLLLVVDE